jgi:putative acyl-CoA dehydrogenase
MLLDEINTSTPHSPWKTHEVTNQFPEASDYNLFTTDTVLNEWIQRIGAQWTLPELTKIGEDMGKSETVKLGDTANRFTPILKTFDSRGNRIDVVEFHPSWHWFMEYTKQAGLISRPFEDEKSGRWAFSAANFILQAHAEAGSLCPATMTQAAIPVLKKEPELWKQIESKILSREYDERDVPITQKKSIWIGMGMTEKQGGSDVRSNTTVATPVDKPGRGQGYLLRGHKWFFSAPMCDAHLVVARTSDSDALACFFVPRWKPDGTKNPIQIQRLKDKVGNKSNSSSEVEFQDAWGILIGEEGRGIPTIIEMATYTRLCCVLGSAGIIRQATVQGIAYTRRRKAFGKHLYGQPLMRNVLVDFALESEAATLTAMRLAEAFEKGDQDPLSKALKRFITPAAKYWICKRAVSLTGEAMEVFGGNGYVEEGILGRLFREAPVNSIWEGSGNVMCLDVLRAMQKENELVGHVLIELTKLADGNAQLLKAVNELVALFKQNPHDLEGMGRLLVERLILTFQACLVHAYSPAYMSEAFIQTRTVNPPSANFGAFDGSKIEIKLILERTFPMQ